jgi:cytochrome c5
MVLRKKWQCSLGNEQKRKNRRMDNRSQLRTDPFLIIFLIILFGGGAFWHFKGDKKETPPVATAQPVVATPSEPPVSAHPVDQAHGHIVFENSFFDFGTVTEGDIVKHTFKFRNDGLGKVKFVKTETSCGCTTATGSLKEYAPGESGEMEVVVDTKGKKGIVVKTVTVTLDNNDVEKTELSLAMKLEPPPHPMISNVRNINAEAACKSCHLESGADQSGIFLFHRVCSQCHGKKGVGGFGRALNDAEWQKVDDAHIKKTIQGGLPDKGMPSFVDGVTPALTDEQIDSLVQYIRSLVQQK